MYNIFKKHRRWKLICAILSLSLLTVMAGAAVAPALGLIQAYFADTDRSLVQMIVSMPALFIAGTNLFLFKPLCKRFRARTLLIFGLLLYTVFGCLAGLFSNILMILVCRALVGIGVGIIMPLSTGLLSFYFTRDKQGPLMGYSSALNMLGGVVATLIAGGLAFSSLSKRIKRGMRFIAPALFIISYLFLGIVGNVFGTLAGSAFVGLANGIGVPYIMTSASAKAGRDAATTVMPLISASLYLAQFATPLILSATGHFTDVSSFIIAVFAALLLAAASFTIKEQ